MSTWKCSGCGTDVPGHLSKCMCGTKRATGPVQSDHSCAVVGCHNAGTRTDSIMGGGIWYCRNHYGHDPKVSGHIDCNIPDWRNERVDERMKTDGLQRAPGEARSHYIKRCMDNIRESIAKIESKKVNQ